MKHSEYDVIVIGGRAAGSTLAARLGRYGLKVLLLERATLPSLPAVSSPIIYASTMRLLDEIGADENAYARNTPRIHHMISVGTLKGKLRLPEVHGRDYAYAIDRARFDAALWDTAVSLPNVDGRQQFSVRDLIIEDGQVVGVEGCAEGGPVEEIRARLVIGADGRFSMVARLMKAEKRDEHDENPTSIYYAYWTNVGPLDDEGASAAAYEGEEGYGYLVMDSADGQTVVAIEGRSDIIDPPAGDAEGFYLDMLKRNPALWARMIGAERVTTVRGMRQVGNYYRQPGGPGWALVGDAYHQKDPLDGQGIYNAVITGKALAQQIRRWYRGEIDWDQALADYDETARIKTYYAYRNLQNQVRGNFYGNRTQIPEWAADTLGRWIFNDPNVQTVMGGMLNRQIPPELVSVLAPAAMLGAVAMGPWRDLRRRVEEITGF